jgi:hypothetical protein
MIVNTNSSILMDIGKGLSLMLGLPSLNTWVTKDRPKVAQRGTFGFNSETYSLEYYDGDDWFVAPMQKA